MSVSQTRGMHVPFPQYGDIVWAKMQKYPYWPGEVHKPPKNEKVPATKKPSFWIFFFGTKNFGWVVEDCIEPFEENKAVFSKKSKLKSFMKAITTAEKMTLQKQASEKGSHFPEERLDAFIKAKKTTLYPVVLAERECPVPSTSGEHPPPKKTKKIYGAISQTPEVYKKTIEALEAANAELALLQKESAMATSDEPHRKRSKKGITRRTKGIMINLQDGKNAIQTDADFISSLSAPHQVASDDECYPDEELFLDAKKYSVGVLGLGALGSEVTNLLLDTGHDVTVWNRTELKMKKFLERGAKRGDSPGQVFKSCDLTLVCVSSSEALQTITYMRSGLYATADEKCNLVVFTLMDPDDTMDVSELVAKGVHYLEAPVCRTIGRVIAGQRELDRRSLVVLTSGDEGVFKACSSIFRAISRWYTFIGQTCGLASKIALITNGFIGTTVSAVAEAMALAERTELYPSELLHVLSVSPIGSAFLLHKGKAMMDKEFPARMPLEQLEVAMRGALSMSSKNNHSMPLTAASHQLYVSAKGMNYGERDMAAVFLPARF